MRAGTAWWYGLNHYAPNRHDTGSTSPRSVGEVALIRHKELLTELGGLDDTAPSDTPLFAKQAGELIGQSAVSCRGARPVRARRTSRSGPWKSDRRYVHDNGAQPEA